MANLDIPTAKSDLANVLDGSGWGRGEWLSLARLVTQLGILLTLAAPVVCPVASSSEPVSELDSEGSSGQ